MTVGYERIAKNLGFHLQDLRRRRRLTQAQLAELAEMPRSTLTNLESGAANPSLSNLMKLANALRVPLEELFSMPRAKCRLIKAGDLRSVKKAKGSALVYKLLPDPIPGMEIDRMELDAGALVGGVPHLPGTKEYLHCLNGEFTVHVSGETYILEEGDVLAFPGEVQHSYQNSGKRKAIGLSVVTLAPL